jgi:orotidine-5'-phosphate decarboxylase
MTREQLIETIRQRHSFLCVGIDPVIDKMPASMQESEDPLFEFGKSIIETTQDICVAYKLNTAFYEAHGAAGWRALERTRRLIPDDVLVIADAKRGDIGSSSEQYAKAFFEHLDVDALTVAPYMGRDSIEPFLSYPGKWAVVLALTSNAGSSDFQLQDIGNWKLFEEVLLRVSSWGTEENTMFVAGATQADQLANVRDVVPGHFLLVPGIGAQGGDLKTVCRAALTDDCGLLVNVSRAIIYASDVRAAAMDYTEQMSAILAGK